MDGIDRARGASESFGHSPRRGLVATLARAVVPPPPKTPRNPLGGGLAAGGRGIVAADPTPRSTLGGGLRAGVVSPVATTPHDYGQGSGLAPGYGGGSNLGGGLRSGATGALAAVMSPRGAGGGGLRSGSGGGGGDGRGDLSGGTGGVGVSANGSPSLAHPDDTAVSDDMRSTPTPGRSNLWTNPVGSASMAMLDNGRGALSGGAASSEQSGAQVNPAQGWTNYGATYQGPPTLDPRTFDKPIPELQGFRPARRNTTQPKPERQSHYGWNAGWTQVLGSINRTGDQTQGIQRSYNRGQAPLTRPQPPDSWADRYTRMPTAASVSTLRR